MFHKGEAVILSSTQEIGGVEADPILDGGEYWYRVRFKKRTDIVVQDDLEPRGDSAETIDQLAIQGRWGRLQAFRTALTVERIESDNRSTVFAFKSQRILFEPYQYKPLLKILDSPDRRLLIADEVGLGKTIEAGLVLTELQARRSLDRVLVVCPSRLRDKWREELNRKFDQDFDVLTKPALEQYLQRLRHNPRRHQLRAIISMQTLRSEEIRTALLAEVGHLDMVIVDEAHHARNPSTQTAGMLRDLGEIGDCILLLTATPLHLGNRDLFTLLNALRPTEFRDDRVFDQELKRYAGVHIASGLVRTMKYEELTQARGFLESIFLDGVEPERQNPLAVQVLKDIAEHPPEERRDWVDLERRIQELHPLGTIVTRTRKRDVLEHAPMRKANVLLCQWTEEEDELYRKLVKGSTQGGWINERLSLGQIQRARQAASCLPAAALCHQERAVTSDDEAVELTDILPSDLPEKANEGANDRNPITRLPQIIRDSKYEKLREVLQMLWKDDPKPKVLIFTFFVGTAAYLEERLKAEGIQTLRIAGNVASNPHQPERDERGKRMRKFHDDPNVRVLVSTEVGSEGLDFQFCHHLVNYDLPWNPMVVEQRIGRIDRYGQREDVVHIHNLVVQGTVEEKILLRLYERIGIFRESIGDLESILGETISELQRDYISGKLSPEVAEARVQQAANAILNRKQQLEELQKVAGDLFGHEEYVRDEMRRVGHLGRFISEHSLLALISSFLQSHHPSVRIWDEEPGVYGIRLTTELRHDLLRAARGGPAWVDRSDDDKLLLTTQGALAFRRPDIELINASHPLVRAAIEALKEQLSNATARVGQGRLTLSKEEDPDIGPGQYIVAVYTHAIMGIRPRQVLETVAWSQANEQMLDQEASERFLHLVLENATEWNHTESSPPIRPTVWAEIEREARARNRRLLDNERRENEALYTRRREALTREYQHDQAVKQKRLKTAEARGRVGILAAFRGQLLRSEARYQSDLGELEKKRTATARLSNALAICSVDVNRSTNRRRK